MTILDTIITTARSDPRRIVMSEGQDPRIVEGSLRAVRDGLAQILLVGPETEIKAQLRSQGADANSIEIYDPTNSILNDEFAQAYFELRKHKGVDETQAKAILRKPLEFAAMMVRLGYAQGTIGGAVATTADTVRTAFQIIGKAADAKLVSSFFIMMLDQPHHPIQGALVFADCALVVEPNVEELAGIAQASAHSCQTLLNEQPRVAMLSFSTHGSANHPHVDKVKAATARLRELEPKMLIDGDLQFDAAFVQSVAQSKAPQSPIDGQANVFIFPGLESANIGYKIAQRIGGAKAIGPILQGLAKPANDLSRGCSADDVYHLIAMTVVQAQA